MSVPSTKPTKQLELTAVALTVLASSCTTFVRPTTCERDASACGGIHDARFCDYAAVAVLGADCAGLGLGETKHFCVVTTSACVDTNYAVKDRDCRVLRYQILRDSGHMDCPSGAPTFASR